MRVLAIDPGLKSLGWGFVVNGNYYAHGIIETDSNKTLWRMLHEIEVAVLELMRDLQPDALVIEEYFISRKTLGSGAHTAKAIGVLVAKAGELDIPCVFYSPKTVKLNYLKSERSQKLAENKAAKEAASGNKPKKKKKVTVDKLDIQRYVNKRFGINLTYSKSRTHPCDALSLCCCFIDGRKPLY